MEGTGIFSLEKSKVLPCDRGGALFCVLPESRASGFQVKRIMLSSSCVVQQVKYLALSLQGLGVLLWRGFIPGLGTLFFFFFLATPVAYGSSLARDPIPAAAAT